MNQSTVPATPSSVSDLRELVGKELGPTEWFEITQADIDAFADLTRDRQWIHVDPARASASPFGSTIAHGLFSLSLGPWLFEQLMAFEGFAHALNYGYEKVRFPAPLPVGSKIRMRATVTSAEDVGNDSALVIISQVFERHGADKPVCVAQSVARFTERS